MCVLAKYFALMTRVRCIVFQEDFPLLLGSESLWIQLFTEHFEDVCSACFLSSHLSG